MNIQNIDLNIVIVILLSVFVVIYSTNITKKYPEQILELMKENFVILLFLGLIMYCIHLKKYTISILVSVEFANTGESIILLSRYKLKLVITILYPKAKITKGRHFERRFENRFSTATKTIEIAIRGSTKVAGTLTSPSAAAAKVTVCASVKDVICQSKTDNFRLKKYKPKTKSTWSKPFGSM